MPWMVKHVIETDLKTFTALAQYHPLRRPVLQYMLNSPDLGKWADVETIQKLQNEYVQSTFEVLHLCNYANYIHMAHAFDLLQLRSQLQQFYGQLNTCNESITLDNILTVADKCSGNNDFWQQTFWMFYQLRSSDKGEITETCKRRILRLSKQYFSMLSDTLSKR